MQSWLARAEAQGLERSSLKNYRYTCEKYILPAFGSTKLAALTQEAVVAFWSDLNKNKSAATGTRVIKHFKMILSHAVGADMIDKSVLAGLRVTRSSRHQMRPTIPSLAEVEAIKRTLKSEFEDAVRGHPKNSAKIRSARLRTYPFYFALDDTACRPCELRGLPWKNVHLEEGYIEILQRADAWGDLGSCKTKASYRRLPISPELVSVLRIRRDLCPGSPDDLVFAGEGGLPINQRLTTREFDRIQIRAGVTKPRLDRHGNQKLSRRGKPCVKGKYRIYDLRHLRASIWIADRLNLKELTTRMGHSSIQMTFDTYGHLIEAVENEDR